LTDHDHCNAWNPGLDSDIPRRLLPWVTLFRPENGFVSYEEARELADLTGIKLNELVAIRPERLVVHTLLVRVTADLSVQDGPSYEELGLNLRGMVDALYTQHIAPEMDAICRLYQVEKDKVERIISAQLTTQFSPSVPPNKEQTNKLSFFSRLFGTKQTVTKTTVIEESVELIAIKEWNRLAADDATPRHRACYQALANTIGIIVGHRGAMRLDRALVTRVVTNQVCNSYVAQLVDDYIDSLWRKAIDHQGYRRLPTQVKPVVMNVKGASASGKSTIRPQQRELAGKLEIPWEDFALISPDYWRKYLLDYGSLGEDYKYGAMLTGAELELIDKKLDRYMAAKASQGLMSHLLIDRFRFDSFTLDIDKTADSKLLSRFGDQVYLFFMITPPAETVERAWLRGIDTGRYKAVDDLLYHNVEAFTGMPSLFLSWVNSKDRKVRFEFLDNDVPLGNLPKTAAFGVNGTMTILDLSLMVKVDRYRQVDITATAADHVLKTSPETNSLSSTDFIVQCSKTVHELIFADQLSMNIYAKMIDGRLVWWDDGYIRDQADSDVELALTALGYTGKLCSVKPGGEPVVIDQAQERKFLVGQIG